MRPANYKTNRNLRWVSIRLTTLLCFCLLGAGCVTTTTPLPVPPTVTADIEAMDLAPDDRGGVLITGNAGAIDPGEVDIRMTFGGPEIDSMPPLRDEFTVAADGSFQTWLMGTTMDTFFIEHVWINEDFYIIAITGFSEIDTPGDVFEADPGLDSDNDGSPDIIDCAPFDENLSGQRCP